MSVERGRHLRVAYGVGIVCVSVLLFWLLPVLIWRNSWGFSEWYSRLPGIDSGGGLSSGVVATLYLLVGVALVGGVVFATGGGLTETATPGDGAPGESPDTGENTTDTPSRATTDDGSGTEETDSGGSGSTDDTDGEQSGDDEPEATAEVEVRFASVPESVVAGDTVEISATVENVGNASARQQITLDNGSQRVALAPGDAEEVRFEWTPQESGPTDLTVASQNDTATATVEVIEPTPDFEVEVVGTNAPVSDREPLSVTATITNSGTGSGTQQITLRRQEFREDTRNVTLASGASTNVTLTWEPATPHGEHELRVASANDSAGETVTVESVNESVIAGQVFIMEEGEVAEAGVVNLYDAEGEELLDSVDLAQTNGSYRFTDLEPGTEYRLKVPSAIGTLDNGLAVDGDSFPTAEYTVTATEIQQSVPLTYGFEFQGADHYRWEHWLDADVPDQHWLGEAKYANGEANITERLIKEWTDGFSRDGSLIQWFVYVNDTSYHSDNNQLEGIWQEDPQWKIMKPVSLPHQTVQDPTEVLSELEWEYEGREMPGENIGTQQYAYEYELSGFENAGFEPYPGATIYIDPETGYVIHWQSEKHDPHPKLGLADRFGELRFFDHGGHSITVESPRKENGQ
jgi:hypothetical protein